MKQKVIGKLLVAGAVTTVFAFAEISMSKANGVVTITADKSGKITAKVIGPDDKVIINETYEGNSFSWTPSGNDGAYRYDVVIGSEYAGGSVEVVNGTLKEERERREK